MNRSRPGGRDTLTGGDGATSGGEADSLRGEEGNDALDGGAGDDFLEGGLGSDILRGGTGDDTFVFDEDSGGLDRILDFDQGPTDSITDGDNINIAGDTFDRTPIQANTGGFVRVEDQGDDAVVQIDADGNGTASTFVDLAVLNGQAGIAPTIAILDSGTVLIY